MSDLNLIPTQDLIHNLINRFDNAVFVGMQVAYEGKETILTRRKYKGNFAVCAGLCTQMIHIINNDERASAAPHKE